MGFLSSVWKTVTKPFKKAWSYVTNIGKKTYNVATDIWKAIRDIWDELSKHWGWITKIWDKVNVFLPGWIRTIGDQVLHVANEVKTTADKIITWIDDIYNKTIGKIDKVYNTLFGKIEKVWRDFEDTRDKILRLIGIFNKDLSRKIYEATERVEADTIGWIRNLRDELEHRIDKVYEALRAKINDLYWALKDIIDQTREVVFRVKDVIDISFEKPRLLSRDTVKLTADTYGLDWWHSISDQVVGSPGRQEVTEIKEGKLMKKIDEYVDMLDADKEGPWRDVTGYIDKTVYAMDHGGDPESFKLDASLLTENELAEYREIPRYPDDPGAYLTA
ncbi:MAG: hypothetical protein J7J19_03580 [Thaumarchaeota archaeon]|nr:hypothetical protein [Nitrososphaerota archaeon]